jgi:hypothetical protein
VHAFQDARFATAVGSYEDGQPTEVNGDITKRLEVVSVKLLDHRGAVRKDDDFQFDP